MDVVAEDDPAASSRSDSSPGKTGDKEENPGDGKGAFQFAHDQGGKLLETLLPPSEQGRARMDARTGPRRPAAASPLDNPSPSLPLSLTPPRPVKLEKPLRALRPAPVRDPLPLDEYHAKPRLPQPTKLASGPRTRLPSPNVNDPLPLPALASQVSDRAGLDDPTGDASIAAALALSPAPRTNPATFVRRSLPDPFEHRDTVKLRKPPAEETTPSTASPRQPNKSP
jgi:hypothetical protein